MMLEMVEVYFDDFKVEHVKSPVIQSEDFYPFGLTFNSYSRENSVANQYKFQGQEHQDELDLGWDSFKWRNHMPDIGRFFNIDPLADTYVYNSPYAFSENHVTSHVELEGLEMVDIKQDVTKKDPLPQQKGNPEEPWTGFDWLNFLDGEKKETPGTQKGVGILVYSKDGGGPDEEYLKEADPYADLLDLDKDALDAIMTIDKQMPRGKGVGEGVAESLYTGFEAKQNEKDAFKKSPNDSIILNKHTDYGEYDSFVDVGVDYVKGSDTLFQFRTIDYKTGDTSEVKTKKLNKKP